MELARDLRARQSTFKYIQKYAPENYVPPKEQRFSVKRIHTLVAAILADQRSRAALNLAPFTKYLIPEVLWEVGHLAPPEVRHVNLQGWQAITTVALRSLSLALGERLVELDLSRSNICTDPLQFSSIRFFALRKLDLSRSHEITDRSVAVITDGCRHTLTSINLSHCPQLTKDGLLYLSGQVGHPPRPCAKLRSLNAEHCPLLKDDGVVGLARGCRQLEFLNLAHDILLTDKSIKALSKGCPRLSVVNVERLAKVTDSSLVLLGKRCCKLRSLNLAGLYTVTDHSMKSLGDHCHGLQQLNLGGVVHVTEMGLYYLAVGCPLLQVLNVDGCEKVTVKGLNQMVHGRKFVRRASEFFGFVPVERATTMKLSYQRRLVEGASTVRIQCLFRGFRTRKRLEIERRNDTEARAAVTITDWFRDLVSRIKNGQTSEGKRRTRAAIRMQTVWRMGLAVRKVVKIRAYKAMVYRKRFAISRCKALLKGMLTRRHHPEIADAIRWMQEDRMIEVEQIVALRLQATVRGRLSRLKFRATIEEQIRRRSDMHYAALVLQRNWRGHAGRVWAEEYKRQVLAWRKLRSDSAFEIQRIWHGFQGRQYARWFRANRARILWERHKACVQIQRIARGNFGRAKAQRARERRALETKWAIRLQSIYRQTRVPHWRQTKLTVVQRTLLASNTREEDAAKHHAHERWRKVQAELARDSCSEDSDAAVPSDEDWQEVWDDEAQQNVFFSPSRNVKTYKYIDVRKWEKSLVGRRCRIFWTMEAKWYDGKIIRYNAKRNRFKVVHEDGDVDWINMHAEAHRVQLQDGDPPVWTMFRMLRPADPIREHLRQQEAEVAARQAAEQEAAAAHAAQMQLAVAWERHVDEASGLPYWHNIETGETTWDNPVPGGGTDTGGVAEVVEMGYSGAGYGAGGALVPKAGGALTIPTEPHWVRTWSEDYGCYYYYNPTTMETSYQVPQGGFVDDATGEVVAV